MSSLFAIGGTGRSGSTLLAALASTHFADAVGVGEVAYFFRRALPSGSGCSCGALVRECPFWGEIIKELPALTERERRALADQAASLMRVRLSPRGHHRPLPDGYVEYLRLIYRALANRASVIVDSSKYPGYLNIVMREVPLEGHLVHLVRDPRAVAYSWEHPKETQTDRGVRSIGAMPWWKSALVWRVMNRDLRELGSEVASITVRYEELAENPESVMGRLAREMRLGVSTELAGRMHFFSGNPSIFSKDQMGSVATDRRWETGLAIWKQVAIDRLAGSWRP